MGISDLRGCIWVLRVCEMYLRIYNDQNHRNLPCAWVPTYPQFYFNKKNNWGISNFHKKKIKKTKQKTFKGISNLCVNGINSIGSILWNLGGFWRSWNTINFRVLNFEVLCIWKKIRKGGNLACKIGRFWIDMQRGQKVQNGRVSIGKRGT